MSNDLELANYIDYSEVGSTISYTPPKYCNAQFKYFLELRTI